MIKIKIKHISLKNTWNCFLDFKPKWNQNRALRSTVMDCMQEYVISMVIPAIRKIGIL